MEEARRFYAAALWPRATITEEVDTELPFRGLNDGVGFATWWSGPFAKVFKVMYQGFHKKFHGLTRRWCDFLTSIIDRQIQAKAVGTGP